MGREVSRPDTRFRMLASDHAHVGHMGSLPPDLPLSI